jgi:hypothetical protein
MPRTLPRPGDDIVRHASPAASSRPLCSRPISSRRSRTSTTCRSTAASWLASGFFRHRAGQKKRLDAGARLKSPESAGTRTGARAGAGAARAARRASGDRTVVGGARERVRESESSGVRARAAAAQPARSKSPESAGTRTGARAGAARAGAGAGAGAGAAGTGTARAAGTGTEGAARRASGDRTATPMVGGARGVRRVKPGRGKGCLPYENQTVPS